jgi:hypothetical protein
MSNDVEYAIYSTWIDGIPRITRITRGHLEKSPKWIADDQPLPLSMQEALRLAKHSIETVTAVDEAQYRWQRITLQSIEPDKCFWFISFIHNDRTAYYSIEIGVLMDGTVVMPEHDPEAKNPFD